MAGVDELHGFPCSVAGLTIFTVSIVYARKTEGFAVYERTSQNPLRYHGHDYRAPCIVHVTICTHHRQPLFGSVTAEGVRLNGAGRLVEASLRALRSRVGGVAIDTHIVMPDHLHAIIVLGTSPHALSTVSIPDIVHAFKMRVLKSWQRGVRTGSWDPYDTRL